MAMVQRKIKKATKTAPVNRHPAPKPPKARNGNGNGYHDTTFMLCVLFMPCFLAFFIIYGGLQVGWFKSWVEWVTAFMLFAANLSLTWFFTELAFWAFYEQMIEDS